MSNGKNMTIHLIARLIKRPCIKMSQYFPKPFRTTKLFSSHPFTIASFPLAPFCLCLFLFCCFSYFSFTYCFHYLYASYRYLLLSQLHFAFTSSLYNTHCNRFYNNYVIDICPRQLR